MSRETGGVDSAEDLHATRSIANEPGSWSVPGVGSARCGDDEGTAARPSPDRNNEEREDRAGLNASPLELDERRASGDAERYSIVSLDRAFRAGVAQLTQGITPFGVTATFMAWWLHLMASPGKQLLLAEKAGRKATRLARFGAEALVEGKPRRCIEPLPNDHRFDDEAWDEWPYNYFCQNFLLTQQWWHNATNHVEGLSRHQEKVMSFITRQILDTISPSNFVPTNPEVTRATIAQSGANLVRGVQNMLEDWDRHLTGRPPVGAESFVPGEAVATTPGTVVYRNRLIELIQYSPTTETVQAEPILIVPAWIMKYYILDLSPHNSLVKYLVDCGFTVFMISWRNPTGEDRDLGMSDYVRLGIGEALDAVTEISSDAKVQAVGYCIGGTLATIVAAAMARDDDDRLKTLTLFATQTDFTEAGEMMLFTGESEISFIEDMMWDRGYLDTRQMSAAFQLLRSNDLIWSRYVHEYLMGRRQELFDLMAWNADATRMPFRMHSQYLRRIQLENQLAQGKYEVGGRPVAVRDICVPIFCVATEADHVAPWRSVYKLHLIADTDITFMLTKGGHNAGIVSEPHHPGRHYRMRTNRESETYIPPEDWLGAADKHDGSWWPAWVDWLTQRSSGEVSAPAMGGGLAKYSPKAAAPGTYVLQR